MVDKFFEIQCVDALKALDIYRRAGAQAERLSEFYETCKSLNIGRGKRFIKIEQPPASFLQAMEEYVREAPCASSVRNDSDGAPKVILAIEYKKVPEVQERQIPSPPHPEPEPVKVEAPIAEPPPDLLVQAGNWHLLLLPVLMRVPQLQVNWCLTWVEWLLVKYYENFT